MKKELLIKGEALQASVASALAAEQFLNEHYLFRRNQLNGKVEFSAKPAEGQEPVFRPSQHASLKQTLSKNKVNGRPIYGCAQEDRPRYASLSKSASASQKKVNS